MMGAAIAQTTPAPTPPPAPVVGVPTEEFNACPTMPADPAAFPDGATAKAKDMESAQKRYNDWEAAIAPGITCRRAAQQKVKAAAEATTAAFNAEAIRVNNVRNTWKTQAEAFTARQAAVKERDNRTGRQ
jgi:hypothetical protein